MDSEVDGHRQPIVAEPAAFVIAGAIMFVVAWLIEKLVPPPGQPGRRHLLMATLGITYFLEGLGQTLFGSDIYKIDVGMPQGAHLAFDSVFQGGILINKEDVIAAAIAAGLVALLSVFFQKTSTGRALRAGRTTTRPRNPSAFRSTASG